MKTITFKSIFALMLCLNFAFISNAASITNPVITTTFTKDADLHVILEQTAKFTFDFSASALTGSENLVIYFWAPAPYYPTGSSVGLTYDGNMKWSLTLIPTTFFNKSAAEIAENPDQFWFNIQNSANGDASGSLHISFSTPVSTNAPVSITGVPSGTYALDQPVTWTFDLSSSSFKAGQDIYMYAWSPSNPDPSYNNSTAISKLTYVSGMVWSKTITPTTYFGKTVAEIQASAGFWMKLKDLAGKIETGAFTVPQTITGTGLSVNHKNNFEVYPNPVVDKLNIKLKDNGFDNVSIYDFKGSLIVKQPLTTAQSELSVNFENYRKGVYMVVLNGKSTTQSIKVVK
jgi:hypothetical protein